MIDYYDSDEHLPTCAGCGASSFKRIQTLRHVEYVDLEDGIVSVHCDDSHGENWIYECDSCGIESDDLEDLLTLRATCDSCGDYVYAEDGDLCDDCIDDRGVIELEACAAGVHRWNPVDGLHSVTWTSGLRAKVGDRVATADDWIGTVTAELVDGCVVVKLDVGLAYTYERRRVRLIVPGAIDPLPEDMDEEQYQGLMSNYD